MLTNPSAACFSDTRPFRRACDATDGNGARSSRTSNIRSSDARATTKLDITRLRDVGVGAGRIAEGVRAKLTACSTPLGGIVSWRKPYNILFESDAVSAW